MATAASRSLVTYRHPWLRSAVLAVRDVVHDRWSSLGTALAIFAVVTPVLLLRGLQLGAVGVMRAEMERDPHAREVLVTGSGSFGPDLIETLRTCPDVAFLLTKPRFLNSSFPARRVSGGDRLVELEIEPTAPGDPLLEGVPAPEGYEAIVLTRRAAEQLGATSADTIRMTVRRRTAGGEWEARRLELRVVAVLAEDRDRGIRGYVAEPLARAIELWREGAIEADPEGALPPPELVPQAPAARLRLYARSLEGAPRLRQFLERMGIEASLREERVATLLELAEQLDRLFAALVVLVTIGLVAMLAVGGWQRVQLRLRDLAVLRLLGFTGWEVGLFPVVQVGLLTTGGIAAGAVAAFASGPVLGDLVRGSLGLEGRAFHLPPLELAAALAGGTLVSSLATAAAARHAARIEPAEVLHDV